MEEAVTLLQSTTTNNNVPGLTPKQIVEELDKYIVGQEDAKKAVAIALRNRARRKMLDDDIRDEVYPKNIIMIGATGVGKTEIARRLAKLEDAPFVKVEASKFTEVGYVGRDVESMIRDLVEIAVTRERAKQMEANQEAAAAAADERILDLLVPRNVAPTTKLEPEEGEEDRLESTRDRFRTMLKEGKLEDKMIEPEISERSGNVIVGMPPNMGLEEMGMDLKDMVEKMMPSRKKRQKMKVKDARPHIVQQEADRMIDQEKIVSEAIKKVQESGIVFLDEIDKVVAKDGGSGPDVSRSGVQRDILPLVEGSTVFTKYGMLKTDHILFIAAGAFHGTSPSDLIPELQGRFPIRVELDDLNEADFKRILKEPKNSLLRQYEALMRTENVTIQFTEDAIDKLAEMASTINEETENIGARRLHTILEALLDEISYTAPDRAGETIEITEKTVEEKLGDIVSDTDLSKYIL